jgi:hypothetical protein
MPQPDRVVADGRVHQPVATEGRGGEPVTECRSKKTQLNALAQMSAWRIALIDFETRIQRLRNE